MSRVINDSGYVAPKTRKLVLDAIEKVGYKPFSAARQMASQKHETVGVITEHEKDENFYRSSFITAASIALSDKGYRMIIGVADPLAHLDKVPLLNVFGHRCMDGIIFDLHRLKGNYDDLLKLQLPAVFVNPPCFMQQNAVIPDDVWVAQEATERLIKAGHKKIAYMPYLTTFVHGSQFDRMKGYAQAICGAGLSCVRQWDVPLKPAASHKSNKSKAQHQAIKKRINDYVNKSKCTAVVAYDMRSAARIAAASQEIGLKIPQDFSLIACDYEPFVKFLPLQITSFRLDRTQMAKTAVEMLMQKVQHNVKVPSALIKGQFYKGNTIKAL